MPRTYRYWTAHSDLDWYGDSGQEDDRPDDDRDDDAEDNDGFGSPECTCRRTGLGGNDPDNGWRLDRNCAVHGEDPDAARERQRDDREDGR